MDGLPFGGSDLLSFAGLAIVVPAVVGGLKTFAPKLVAGREPLATLVITYALGIAAKFAAPEVAFGGQKGMLGWLVILVGLFFSALGAGQVHDTFINKVLTSKGDPRPPSPDTGPPASDSARDTVKRP